LCFCCFYLFFPARFFFSFLLFGCYAFFGFLLLLLLLLLLLFLFFLLVPTTTISLMTMYVCVGVWVRGLFSCHCCHHHEE